MDIWHGIVGGLHGALLGRLSNLTFDNGNNRGGPEFFTHQPWHVDIAVYMSMIANDLCVFFIVVVFVFLCVCVCVGGGSVALIFIFVFSCGSWNAPAASPPSLAEVTWYANIDSKKSISLSLKRWICADVSWTAQQLNFGQCLVLWRANMQSDAWTLQGCTAKIVAMRNRQRRNCTARKVLFAVVKLWTKKVHKSNGLELKLQPSAPASSSSTQCACGMA